MVTTCPNTSNHKVNPWPLIDHGQWQFLLFNKTLEAKQVAKVNCHMSAGKHAANCYDSYNTHCLGGTSLSAHAHLAYLNKHDHRCHPIRIAMG